MQDFLNDFHHLLPPGKEKYSGIFRTEEPTGVVQLLKGVRAYGLHLKVGTDLGRIKTAVFLSTGQIFLSGSFRQGPSQTFLCTVRTTAFCDLLSTKGWEQT